MFVRVNKPDTALFPDENGKGGWWTVQPGIPDEGRPGRKSKMRDSKGNGHDSASVSVSGSVRGGGDGDAEGDADADGEGEEDPEVGRGSILIQPEMMNGDSGGGMRMGGNLVHEREVGTVGA